MSYETVWASNPSLNDVERAKLKKDGLDIIPLITQRYAQSGYASILPEDMGLFKWAGLYEQKPKNGFFMMRIRVDSGVLSFSQAKILAQITNKYARSVINITTRGSIQLHWIRIEDVPAILASLNQAGLYTLEACGDCPRTIVGNPLAGIDLNELMDTTEMVRQVKQYFLANRDFSNLPRKFKISISASTQNAAHAQINDIAFTPAIKILKGEKTIGFHVWVGGGLSAQPYLAQKLDLFICPEKVLSVIKGVCTIFRDYGYRKKRAHARMKFLVSDWGAEKFKNTLLEFTGPLPSSGMDMLKTWRAAYYYGVHPQKQSGKSYVGLHIPLGELTGDEFATLAMLSKKYGDGTIRTTLSQNLIISGIKDETLLALLDHPVFNRLQINPKTFLSYTVACTGNHFCNLALVETRKCAKDITSYLDTHITLKTPIRIHVTGCPNSCGQKQIADISLQGARLKTSSGWVAAFDVFLGGSLDGEGQFAQNILLRTKLTQVHLLLERILLFYQGRSYSNESFKAFVTRIGIEKIRHYVAV
ncbi:nitrite/sulfite reductase [Megasphaera cerevisiae]|uniref:nitrite/sulfite reductase n=1 Tax=Megasphaera cerevisiae TaxID=39029 RepID=UPI000944183A|nr:ferredoxin--nitrite reductase [Megasphaera cerevisiae]MCI1751249.1 hypothetical protein [Megasphaera cerevisiae]OKY52393.1 ferredoxin--nitrite reductase [Megasphaera cerevisiae]